MDTLNVTHPSHALAVVIAMVWIAVELLSLPKSRAQLRLEHGDWLSIALGTVPAVGAGTALLYEFLQAATPVSASLLFPGLILFLAGIGLRIWSRRSLGRFYTFDISVTPEHRVTTAGPYRFVRHPLYLGTFLTAAGLPLITQGWMSVWLFAVPTTAIYGLRLVREDAYLMTAMGSAYRDYAHRTARLIPFIW